MSVTGWLDRWLSENEEKRVGERTNGCVNG